MNHKNKYEIRKSKMKEKISLFYDNQSVEYKYKTLAINILS
jgi:hypothetical protein